MKFHPQIWHSNISNDEIEVFAAVVNGDHSCNVKNIHSDRFNGIAGVFLLVGVDWPDFFYYSATAITAIWSYCWV